MPIVRAFCVLCVLAGRIISPSNAATSGSTCSADLAFDTDVVVRDLPFVKDDVDTAITGLPFPNIFKWQVWDTAKQLYHFFTMWTEYRDVKVLDARKRKSLTYEKQGFVLLPFKSTVTDWRSHEGIQAYKKELEVFLKKLHPQMQRVVFTNFVHRGGRRQTRPATNKPHLDNYQNKTEVLKIADTRGGGKWMREEVAIMRDGARDGFSPRIMLGLWKPVDMSSPVCDFPLMMMDASRFREKDQVRNLQHFNHAVNGKRVHVTNLAARAKFAADQRWYYFHEQKEDELTVFRHFTFDYFFANVHGAFKQRNCPEGAETRKSIETRATLYW